MASKQQTTTIQNIPSRELAPPPKVGDTISRDIPKPSYPIGSTGRGGGSSNESNASANLIPVLSTPAKVELPPILTPPESPFDVPPKTVGTPEQRYRSYSPSGASGTGRTTSAPSDAPAQAEIVTATVQAGGGVKVGDVTYYGQSTVPYTGKTANQLQDEAFEAAREQGISKGGSYKYTTQYTKTGSPVSKIVEEIPESSGSVSIYRKQIDTFKGVPVYKIYAREKQGFTTKEGETFKTFERPATSEEEAYYQKQTNVLRAVTKEQTEPRLTKESFFYEAIPYVSEKVVQGLRNIPEFQKFERSTNLDLPVSIANIELPITFLESDINIPLPIGSIAQSTVSTVPLLIFDIPTRIQKPFISKTFKPEINTNFISDIKTARLPSGEVADFSRFTIQSKVAPARVEVTTLERQFLGFEPFVFKAGRPQTYSVSTIGYAQVGKDFLVLEKSPKSISISRITQSSDAPMTIKNLQSMKLTQVDKRLIQDVAERLTPEKFIGKVIGKEDILTFSNLESEMLLKVRGKIKTPVTPQSFEDLISKGYIPESTGKRVIRARELVRSTELILPEESKVLAFKEKVTYRPTKVTFPEARTGTSVKMKGTTFKYKEQFEIDIVKRDLKGFKFDEVQLKANIPEKTSSPLNQYQIQQTIKEIKEVQGLPKIAPSIPRQTSISSQYQGKSLSLNSNILNVGTAIVSKELSLERLRPETQTKSFELNKELSRELNKELSKELNKELSRELNKELSRELNKELSRELNKELSKEIVKEIQKEVLTPTPSVPFVPIRPTNRIYPPKIKFAKSPKKKNIRKIPTYAVALRKRGKFKPIATGLSRGQALRFGSEKALNTLARSFLISSAGKTKEIFGIDEEVDFMPSEKLFRQYVVRKGQKQFIPNLYVQLTSANLKSFGEKSEIKLAKQLKSKGFIY